MTEREGIRIGGSARAQLDVGPSTFAPDGSLPLANVATARRVAVRLDALGASETATPVLGGELNAFGIIDLVLRHVVELYLAEAGPDAMAAAVRDGAARLGKRPTTATLERFRDDFPLDVDDEPSGAVVRDLVLASVANANPATTPFRLLIEE